MDAITVATPLRRRGWEVHGSHACSRGSRVPRLQMEIGYSVLAVVIDVGIRGQGLLMWTTLIAGREGA